jgi:hypothetical protein
MNTSYSIKTKIKYKWKAIGYQYKKKKPSNLGDQNEYDMYLYKVIYIYYFF